MDYQPLTPPTGQGSTPATPATSTVPGIPDMPLPKDLAALTQMAGGGGGGSRKGGSLLLIFVVVLGICTLVFGLLALTSSAAATKAQSNLSKGENAFATAAASAQKKLDAKNEAAANESPFRSYVAPVTDGSFQINFPKDWSGWVDQEDSGTTVTLIVNPNFVNVDDGQPDLAACKVELIQTDSNTYMQQFSGNVQSGQLQQSNITVSGVSGYNLTGDFGDQRTTREVVVPVRDEVLVFINENGQYASEFNEILAQAKVNP